MFYAFLLSAGAGVLFVETRCIAPETNVKMAKGKHSIMLEL